MDLTLFVGPGARQAGRRAVARVRREDGTFAVVEAPRLDRAGAQALERFASQAASRRKVFATSLDRATRTGINAALRAIEEGPGRMFLSASRPPMLTIASRAVETVRCPAPSPEELREAGIDPDAFVGGTWPASVAHAHALVERQSGSAGAHDRVTGLLVAATKGDRPAVRAHVVSFGEHEAEALGRLARKVLMGGSGTHLSEAVARAVVGWRAARPRVLASATAELVMVEADQRRRAGVRT